MDIDRVFDVLTFQLSEYNLPVALAGKKKGEWKTYSTIEYIKHADWVSLGLLSLNIKKEDKIVVIAGNAPEWNFIDMGVQQIGAVHVPLIPNISDENLIYILNQTEAKIIFIDNRFLEQRIVNLKPKLDIDPKVIYVGKSKESMTFEELVDIGKQTNQFEQLGIIKASINKEDIASIVYTSGTTMMPKGVMLSHKNLCSIFKLFIPSLQLNSSFKALMSLPMSHIGVRKYCYTCQFSGIPIYHAGAGSSVIAVAQELKPDILGFVPMVLEKIFEYIKNTGTELEEKQRKEFDWAVDVALNFNFQKLQSDPDYQNDFIKAKELYFNDWKNLLGGNVKRVIAGGAAAPIHLLKFFWAIDVPVHEVYGLTETSSLVSINHHNDVKFGTVGKPYKGVQVKISDEGEVLVKGPNIMQGYFKKPELTNEVIDEDDFFHTGDIGQFDENGYLKITGRKSDMFKTMVGDFISPEIIENKLKKSPYISQSMVVGSNKSYLAALIVPDFDQVRDYLKNKGIILDELERIVELEETKKLIEQEIERYNDDQWDAEKVKRFKLVAENWTIEKGQLNGMMKLKRNIINEKYEQSINELYKY